MGISDGNFDDGLKRADLIHLLKHDGTISKKNYRNISLLSAVSKIFEKGNPKTNWGQFGHLSVFIFVCLLQRFRCTNALLLIVKQWRVSPDKVEYGDAVLMDLSREFYTINHDLIIA